MTGGFDARTADALLNRLATDDGFRERFEAQPDAALNEMGYKGPISIAACFKGPLADKKTILDSREALRKQLTSELDLMVFRL